MIWLLMTAGRIDGSGGVMIAERGGDSVRRMAEGGGGLGVGIAAHLCSGMMTDVPGGVRGMIENRGGLGIVTHVWRCRLVTWRRMLGHTVGLLSQGIVTLIHTMACIR